MCENSIVESKCSLYTQYHSPHYSHLQIDSAFVGSIVGIHFAFLQYRGH
jgi:hypothetical protein